MHQLKPTDLWVLWQRGIPVTQAFYKIGPKNYLEEYNNLAKTKPQFDLLTAMTAAQETAKEKPGDFAALSRNFSLPEWPEKDRFNELERHLQSNILNGLRRNILFGIGFAMPRHPNDIPAIVPQDAWNHFIGWHNGKIEKGSLKMEDIRICFAKANEKKEVRAGRPSRVPLIIEAFEVLMARGEINLSKSINHHFDAIRQEVYRQHPDIQGDITGLGDKTLHRELSTLINAVKR